MPDTADQFVFAHLPLDEVTSWSDVQPNHRRQHSRTLGSRWANQKCHVTGINTCTMQKYESFYSSVYRLYISPLLHWRRFIRSYCCSPFTLSRWTLNHYWFFERNACQRRSIAGKVTNFDRLDNVRLSLAMGQGIPFAQISTARNHQGQTNHVQTVTTA